MYRVWASYLYEELIGSNFDLGLSYSRDSVFLQFRSKGHRKAFELKFVNGFLIILPSHPLREHSKKKTNAVVQFKELSKQTVKDIGEFAAINIFYDLSNFVFKFKFLGKEKLNTKFGVVSCLKFRPYVESGRVFNKEEGLTLWISDDENKMPIRLTADLRVGSIDADLDAFRGLKHPFKIIVNE